MSEKQGSSYMTLGTHKNW